MMFRSYNNISEYFLSDYVAIYGGPQLSRQNTIHHGKIKLVTAKYNSSRQNTIRNNKFKLLTANYKHSRQKKKQLLQFKIHQGKSKTLTAKSNQE